MRKYTILIIHKLFHLIKEYDPKSRSIMLITRIQIQNIEYMFNIKIYNLIDFKSSLTSTFFCDYLFNNPRGWLNLTNHLSIQFVTRCFLCLIILLLFQYMIMKINSKFLYLCVLTSNFLIQYTFVNINSALTSILFIIKKDK